MRLMLDAARPRGACVTAAGAAAPACVSPCSGIEWCSSWPEAERDVGRPGWRPESDVYEHYLPGSDEILGPFGTAGPE